MRGLLKMSKNHNIEAKLYHGDTINNIYKILGEGRVTRWLSSIYGETLDEKQTWFKLIEFLEKDVKIHQHKLMVYGGKHNTEKRSDWKSADIRKKAAHNFQDNFNHVADSQDRQQIHSTNDMNICLLCGESDHVATRGPGGGKIIQYFTCKKFVQMSQLQRFVLLRSKGYCFQCLLPGAMSSDKKHKIGRCQRDLYVLTHHTSTVQAARMY